MTHTISILCDDIPGVMTRISGLFSRRGFNIESLTVGHTERPGKSRFTIVVEGDDGVLEQVRKQLQKLVHVIKVWDLDHERILEREHALVKVEVHEQDRANLLQLITVLQARILNSSGSIWVLEITGDSKSVDSAINLLSQYTILESIRTGKIALEQGAKERGPSNRL
ncbi:MAG: acetolactate synthase small subunit [Spirochaetaceae bacterium]|nr:acetolactate synthase small subunit [Spirochaetaceae bacterium]MCF7948790.1 acetolactate synthase small subunit [Spirochaetia bacterium]MCF7951316.1 acetolactate synthase small subunit [Spirochaetaceae bacterium]